jgi:putative endonuclease
MLCCADGSFYAGAARDLEARLRQHQAGKASRYTRARLPVRIAWSRRVRTWSHALRTEHRLKRLTRTEKASLVDGAAWRIDGKPRPEAPAPARSGVSHAPRLASASR